MPGAEVSNLSGKWVDGSLYIYDGGMTVVAILSSTGIDLRGGGTTISTASLVGSSTVISTAALVGTLTGSTNALLKTSNISTCQLMSCVISTSDIVGVMTASSNAIISGCNISTAQIMSPTISSGNLVGTLTGSTNAIIKTANISTCEIMSCTLSTGNLVGKLTASTNAIISGCPISTAVLSAPTISSGITRYGEVIINKVANYSLVRGESGVVLTCSTDSVFITLPAAASSGFAGQTYTIRNIATTAQNVIVITTAGDSMIGCSISTSGVLRNVSTSHIAGDEVQLVSGASTTWWIMGMVGVWASTT